MNNTEDLQKEAIDNIRKDREQTDKLLQDLISYIASGTDRHKEVGFTMAKYLETLQRSNEQLVKLIAIKKEKKEDGNLSKEEREAIFQNLNKNK